MRRERTEAPQALPPIDGRLDDAAAGVTPPGLKRPGASWTGWLVALVPLGLTVFFASLLGTVAAGSPLVAAVAWVPSLGVELAFRVDGLGLLFALLISGIGT